MQETTAPMVSDVVVRLLERVSGWICRFGQMDRNSEKYNRAGNGTDIGHGRVITHCGNALS